MKPTFEQFVATRRLTTLETLINEGHEIAKSYADCSDRPLNESKVLAYKTGGDDFSVFIDAYDDRFSLLLGNQEFEARDLTALRSVERELYDWSIDEGYFD